MRDACVGTSICFRGKVNEVISESKANRLHPQIWQIGFKKGSILLLVPLKVWLVLSH